MRVITLNLNGIRSATKKGFFEWLLRQNADVVCLQETRAQEHQLLEAMQPPGYYAYFFDAQKPGYSGVALYTRTQPTRVTTGLGWGTADTEGRYLQADFNNISIASLYLPSGSSGAARQALKFDFLARFTQHLQKLADSTPAFIIGGDFNIAHHNIDIKNWRGNLKNSGFLPEERAWLDQLFGTLGWVDAFRAVNQQAEQYTWWSNRGRAWANNVGWRIDYQVVSAALREKIRAASIYKDQRFSDHAPLIIDYDFTIN